MHNISLSHSLTRSLARSPACSPDITGTVTLPEGTEMVMPGDNITATFNLISPVPVQQGLKFAIREGGRTVGAGVIVGDK